MKAAKLFIGVFCACFLMLACAPSEPPSEPPLEATADPAEARAALDRLAPQYEQALSAGDVDGLMALFTADPVRMPPDQPAELGRRALEQAFRDFFALGEASIQIAVEDTVIAGSTAVSRGTYRLTITPAEGEPITEEGKWINKNQREEDGSWKIAWNMWNRNHPVPPVAPVE